MSRWFNSRHHTKSDVSTAASLLKSNQMPSNQMIIDGQASIKVNRSIKEKRFDDITPDNSTVAYSQEWFDSLELSGSDFE